MVIDVRGLSKTYARGRVAAVRDVSFGVERGDVFGLIGPDGAGKTSVLQVLAGVLGADAGMVRVAGVDALADPERVKRTIGYMPQGLGQTLYDSLTVHENIEFFRDLRGLPRPAYRDNRERLLAMTRLQPFLDRPAGALSGGMRQKLALICTLIHLPDVLLLDEPTTGVDPISRRDFWTIIHTLVVHRGVTVLLTTSYMDEAERCHHIGLMHGGRLIASGSPETLVARLEGRGGLADVFLRHLAGSLPSVEAASLFPREAGPAPARHDQPAVSARALTCRFGTVTAVADVSLDVQPGEILGLLGPNGAGKTTLIRMLCGLQPPSSGRAIVAGHDVGRTPARVRASIGYMSQRFSLYRDLTVRENLELSAGLYGIDRRGRRHTSDRLLASLGLDTFADRVPLGLPVGLRQRLALACAIVHAPPVLFLDEPTAGVDPLARRQFWDLVGGLVRERAVAAVVSTHYMEEATHCDRLAFMHEGRLVGLGAPGELARQAEATAGPMVALEVPEFARAFVAIRQQFPDAMLHGRRIRWQTQRPQDDIRRAAAALAAAGMTARAEIQPLSMEDTFVSVLRAAERARG